MPWIVLNHTSISFEANDESRLSFEITLTNQGTARLPDVRVVYLAIDNDTGQNRVRRPLMQVKLRELAPGEQRTFSERLLIPAIRPGHYTIELWIPDPDPSSKFDKAHNLLLNSDGVADPASGLNRVGTFTVLN